MLQIVLALTLLLSLSAAEHKAVIPSNGAKPGGPYSPGIIAGNHLYVAGQGPRSSAGITPVDFSGQARQSLENVKAIDEAAGFNMKQLAYTQIYLSDINNLDAFDKVWREYFPANPPARAILAVSALPAGMIQINAVAAKQPQHSSAGTRSDERFFVSGIFANSTEAAFVQLSKALQTAGLGLEHLAFVNVYIDPSISYQTMSAEYGKHFEKGNAPARATYTVAQLPRSAHIEITGVAVTDLRFRKVVRPRNMAPSNTSSPCVWAGETLYCSSKSGFIPGINGGIWAQSVEDQVRQSFRNLLDGLEEAGLNLSHVVATTVALDQVDDFARMNATYSKYFTQTPPSRSTIQPAASVDRKQNEMGQWPKLEEISIIAVR